MKKKISQSVLEYVVILTAVVAAIIFFVARSREGNTGLGKMLQKAGTTVETSSGRIAGMVSGGGGDDAGE